jgi:hypothetical protein
MGQGAQYPYPAHNINPAEKNADWCMAYAKAAYYDFQFVYPKGIFANNGGDYDKFRMYALGKQPISQYQKLLGVDQATNNTWLSIDWSVRAIVSPYRDRAISRLMEQEHGLVATPIDMMAKSELASYYADMKAKLAVRQLIQQVNDEELGSHPMISLESGEPMDVEELDMRVELGEQFNRSKDAEMAIQVGLYENDYKQFRRSLYEDLFDLGATGYKKWLGEDNKAKYRKVNPNNVGISYSRHSNFNDIVHAFELIDVPLIDLALLTDKQGNKLFTEQQLQEFAGSIAGKWSNPRFLGSSSAWLKPYDKFKCQVMDITFYSYDDYTYTDRTASDGNPVFRMEDYNRGSKDNPRYMRKCFRVVYQCKWIVGTDFCYDWGLMPDQQTPQNPKKKGQAMLPYRFYAYNFYEMKAQGMMERLIPYLDDYQLTMLKIQNFKNRAVPSGWWIDLDALENVALNKGGKNMEPKELLQMFFETGVLVGRSKDAAGNPMGPNWKPVIPIENTAASELAMFYNDIITTIQSIERITGYNEATMGEANPKTLVPGYQMAEMSTSHALYPLKFSENYLSERLGEDVLLLMQQGLRKGEVSGYAPALNSNLLTFMKLSPAIALREYGITLEERTSDDQKAWLLQQMQADIQNGWLDTTDAVLLVNTRNAKQAQAIWSYKVKKAKEAANNQKMKELQLQNQGAQEAAMVAGQMKMQEKQMEWQVDLKKEEMRIMGELKKKEMELQATIQMKMIELGVKKEMNTELSESKVATAVVTGEAKKEAQEIANEGLVIKTAIAGEQSKQKQEIANKKPVSKSK